MGMTREQILGKVQLVRESVSIPEWEDTVYVREMTCEERDRYESGLMDAKQEGRRIKMVPNLKNANARLAVIVLVDEKGEQLFKPNDVAAIGLLSAAAMNRIVDVARRLSGMSKEDIEELAGNSGAGPEKSSTSS